MRQNPIMEILLKENGQTMTLAGENCQVTMTPCSGTVKSEFFTGVVEPCSSATQLVDAARVHRISARIMMTGKDLGGNAVHVYAEINGGQDQPGEPAVFRTVPVFYTDSLVLTPYLHCNQFFGEVTVEKDGLRVVLYEVRHGTTI